MAYIVQKVADLYVEVEEGQESNDTNDLSAWLNQREADGYTLVGVLPDHRIWKEDGEFDGYGGSMLILHKPE